MCDLQEICPWCDGVGLEKVYEPFDINNQLKPRGFTFSKQACYSCNGRGWKYSRPYEGIGPCPCCFESSGHPALYVPATWTDPAYEDVDYSRTCPECNGTGSVEAERVSLDDMEEIHGPLLIQILGMEAMA